MNRRTPSNRHFMIRRRLPKDAKYQFHRSLFYDINAPSDGLRALVRYLGRKGVLE